MGSQLREFRSVRAVKVNKLDWRRDREAYLPVIPGARKARTRNFEIPVWSFGPPRNDDENKNAPVSRGVFAFGKYLP